MSNIINGRNADCPFQKTKIQPIEYICSIICRKKPFRNPSTGETYVCEPVKLKEPVKVEKIEILPEPYMTSCVDRICRIESLKNRIRITWAAITTMLFGLVASFLLFALAGLGIMTLPDKMVYYLGVFTLGSIMSTVLMVFKNQLRGVSYDSRKKH